VVGGGSGIQIIKKIGSKILGEKTTEAASGRKERRGRSGRIVQILEKRESRGITGFTRRFKGSAKVSVTGKKDQP